MRNGGNIIMFSKIKKTAILIAASALLTTSFEGTVVFADTTSNTNDDSSLTTTNSDTTTDTSSTSTTTKTQAGYENIDLASVKLAMLNELNRLRSQNDLKPLTSVDVLNNYAQARTDSFITSGGVDDHSNWHSANMYPYNYTAEENIAQMPFSMIGSTDPLIIAEKITDEFYSETYDSNPDFGHRKNMLNPYISYVGIGVSVSNTGMIYFSQEMGNDQESYSKYDPTDVKDYYMTKYNDYANPSKYDLADANRKGADYTQRKDYTTADLRGGVTTKNYVTPVYDRYGNKSKDLELAQTQIGFPILSLLSMVKNIITLVPMVSSQLPMFYHGLNSYMDQVLQQPLMLRFTTTMVTSQAKSYLKIANGSWIDELLIPRQR